ncbi:thiamine pyrophosphate-dependent enzyme [Bradyrhizobium prioriisuperbiae]|uniref:thiamine pyrophosphate-dependent enzyme n=1 Tax=Bradyrhizobium prioriisuperbiae TaxID=2854389 RepID=UPI0028EAD44B|nr:thiamine pyrophosphate-dependent enzyme [Bradyrhizobium prioritasuperba]
MSATFGTMHRRDAVKALLADRGDLLVVAGLGSSTYDLFAAGEHDANFYLWGAMGGAAMIGLGLAQAQPKRPVLVLTGDGEQLMGLGALFTVGVSRPLNLTIAVLDNGHFGETGMQLSHSGRGARLGTVAEGAGFTSVTDVADLAGIESYRGKLQSVSEGPRFLRISIAPGNPPRVLPPRDGAFVKNRFRQHLGFQVT